MAVEPFLERQSGESGVIPPAVGCLNRRSVHHRLHLAVTIHRAVALCPAVAPFRIGCVASWRSWRLADVVDDGLIMLPDDRGHVRHAAVAHLQRVFIEDLVEPRVLWEMLADERAKLSANVGGNISAKRWVEPSDVAGPILPSHILAVDLPLSRNSTCSLNPLSLNALSYSCHASSKAAESLEMSVRRRLIDEGMFLIMLGGWLDCR